MAHKMASCSQARDRGVFAVIVAGFLMFALGVAHRAVPALLLTPVSTTPIAPDALKRFPSQIGQWLGADVPLDESVLSKIDAEAYVNRQYLRGGGDESISLFIAASGTTGGTLVGHAPEICNVYAGATLLDQDLTQLPLADGMRLPCQILQFVRGDSVAPERVTVLYYYMADDRYCGNRSELRSRVRRGAAMVRCIAQVQIVTSAKSATPDATTATVCSFAVDSASSIAQLFADLKRDQGSDDLCTPMEGQ
jgi:hypothetical protein